MPDLLEDLRTLTDSDIDRNTDFEENSPYQEGIISESYQRLDKSYAQEPPVVGDLLDTGKLIQTFLPKQTDIDFGNYTKESIKSNTFANNSERKPSWIFN